MLPEQASNWAYPQPEMTDEEIVFTMVTGLAGRLYLSGRLDEMTDAQFALVAEGLRVARTWDDAARGAVPVWPLGPTAWDAPWIAVGRSDGEETLIAVWWRGNGEPEIELDLPAGRLDIVYPASCLSEGLEVTSGEGGRTRLRAPSATPTARMLRIRHTAAP